MQLDLLSWRPAVQVIPFPMRHRVGHIRRTAERIQFSRTQREADAYWKRAVDGIIRQMERAGVPDDRIDAEVATFQACVQAEVHRIAHRPHQPDGELA